MEKVRVLVVDDSFFMRQAISKILSGDDIDVIYTAKDGKEGYEKVLELQPDVVTMDIEMPVMTGLESLKKIMEEFPVPVIMVSTLTSEGADATIEGLSLGAVDFITKKSAFKEMDSLKDEIISKVIAVGRNASLQNQMLRQRLRLKMSKGKPPTLKPVQATEKELIKDPSGHKKRPRAVDLSIVCIGISTGGPGALQKVIPLLPKKLPVPIVIVQHMPPFFTKSLAERLDKMSDLTVQEAEQNKLLTAGNVYFAPGGLQLSVDKFMKVKISDEKIDSLYKPSVDYTLNSIIDGFGNRVLAVIMTGMGHDGLDACKKLNAKAGYIIVQEPETCTISGMPKSIIDAGIADETQTLDKIAHAIATCFGMSAFHS